MYNEATLRAIDHRREPPRARTEPARRLGREGVRTDGVLVAGALTAGLLRGVHTALDGDESDDAIVETLDEERSGPSAAVSVHLVWGEPAASVAIVRRWLLPT